VPRKRKVKTEKHLTFEELSSAWWSIHDALDYVDNKDVKKYMIRRSFEVLLEQCGWSTSDWNDENKVRNKK